MRDICTCNSARELTLKDNCHKELWAKSGMLKIPLFFWGYGYTCQNNWRKAWRPPSIIRLCLSAWCQTASLIDNCSQPAKSTYWAIGRTVMKNKTDHVEALLKSLSVTEWLESKIISLMERGLTRMCPHIASPTPAPLSLPPSLTIAPLTFHLEKALSLFKLGLGNLLGDKGHLGIYHIIRGPYRMMSM